MISGSTSEMYEYAKGIKNGNCQFLSNILPGSLLIAAPLQPAASVKLQRAAACAAHRSVARAAVMTCP